MSTLSRRSIPFEAIGASRLFLDYLDGAPALTKHFAHDPWSDDVFEKASRKAAEHETDRETLVRVLLDQNAAWWGGEEERVRERISLLKSPQSVAVLTGQQLGLFGGPLYTVYKALTAVKLAVEIEARTGRSIIPVFWLADEDHDFAEVQKTVIPNKSEPLRLSYEDGLSPEENRGPIGRIILGNEIESVVSELAEVFPELAARLGEIWRPGVRWRDAFAITLRWLTQGTGLVFVSGDDARLKQLVIPLFSREITSWRETHAVLTNVSEQLESNGYHQQIQPGEVNLFHFASGRRLQIDPDGNGFRLRGTDTRFTETELLRLVEEHPEQFSPNVVLRPLMQDRLFPTVVYVAGPGELAYFAQLKPVYEAFGVPMPVIYPRTSFTLISEKLQGLLDTYHLDLHDVKGDLHVLHRDLVLQHSDSDLLQEFAEARAAVDQIATQLSPVATDLDSSLDKAVGAAHKRMLNAVERLEKKTVRVEKRNHAVVLQRLERLAGELFPDGTVQERSLNPLPFVDSLGVDSLLDLVDLTQKQHTAVTYS